MRVLVTGAAGFVGSNLVRRLMSENHVVHAAVRAGGNRSRLDGLHDLAIHDLDLADRAAVLSLTDRVRPEWIFHLAANGAYSSQTDRRRMLETNVVGAYNLAEAALQCGTAKLINTGSSSEYGLKDHAPSESETVEPNSDYAVTKASATLLFQSLARRQGVPMPTLRLYSVYGPFEEPSRLMPTLLMHALRGSLPPLAQPTIARDFIYIDDVCDAFLAVAESEGDPGAIYNVSSGRQTTLADLVALVRQKFGVAQEPSWGSMPNRGWDTTVWVGDSGKLQETVGWWPRVSIAEGLERMADWLKATPERRERYSAAIRQAPTTRAA